MEMFLTVELSSYYAELFEIELTICIKIDLALNNLQRLICHKTQPTNQLLLLMSVLGMTLNCIRWCPWALGKWSTTELPLLAGPLRPEFVVTDRVRSIGQIELFNHLQRIVIIYYLKPYSCVQIICIR